MMRTLGRGCMTLNFQTTALPPPTGRSSRKPSAIPVTMAAARCHPGCRLLPTTTATDGNWSADYSAAGSRLPLGVSKDAGEEVVYLEYRTASPTLPRASAAPGLCCEYATVFKSRVDWYATTDVPRERMAERRLTNAFDNVGVSQGQPFDQMPSLTTPTTGNVTCPAERCR